MPLEPSARPRGRFPRLARLVETDGWVPMLMIGLPALTALLFLALFAGGVRENRLFDREALDTFGHVVDERTCRSGTRFGLENCYRIAFTDHAGQTVVFGARGRTSYRAGFRVLPAALAVQYLPQRPTYARLRGDRADTAITGWLGFGSLAMALLVAGLFLHARHFARRHAGFKQTLDARIETDPPAALLDLAADIADPPLQQTCLQDIALALYQRGHVAEADDALSRALDLNRRHGGSYGRDIGLGVLGRALYAAGHPTAAQRALEAITHRDVRRHFGL